MADCCYPQKDWYKHVKLCDCADCFARGNKQVIKGSKRTLDMDRKYGLDEKVLCVNDRSLDIGSSPRSISPSQFIPTISFDTVPMQGISPEEEEGFEEDYIDGYRGTDGENGAYNYSLDEYYNNEDTTYNSDYHGLWRRPMSEEFCRSISPRRSRSPNFRAAGGVMGKLDILPDGRRVRIDYPSKPTILSDSFVINRTHKDWRRKWKERKEKIENVRAQGASQWYRFPEILFPEPKVDLSDLPVVNDEGVAYNSDQRANMKRIAKITRTPVGFPVSPRTILCHVSGRRHTWVALDWALMQLMVETDHIVVVANLPRASMRGAFRLHPSSRSSSRSRSRSRSVRRPGSTNVNSSLGLGTMVKDKDEEWSEGYTVGNVEHVLQNLLDYITFVVPQDKAIKVTVDIIIGDTKQVLVEALNLHSPDFLVVSSTQYKDNDGLLDHKSKRLTSVLARQYPLPVFIVPAKRMHNFEMSSEGSAFKREKVAGDVSDQQLSLPSPAYRPRLVTMHTSPSVMCRGGFSMAEVDDAINASDITSIDSDVSEQENQTHSCSLAGSFNRVSKLRENYRLRTKDEFSKIDANTSLDADKKSTAKIDSLITASMEFNKELESSGSESILQMQRMITGGEKHRGFRKKSMLDVLDIPTKPKRKSMIQTSVSQGSELPPRKSTIKFEDNVKGSDGSTAVQQMGSDESLREMSPLRQVKSLSQSSVQFGSNTTLRKVRSANANALNRTKSNDSITSAGKRKRTGLFGALFGGSASASTSTSTVTSPITSRRSSMSSNEGAAATIPSGRRKKRWGFLK
ncbi:HHL246Cp [Eremothecium sinecaudum]|uniref:HHL246Cp n=1 Tax=Eremothecium sinecaudum TaxID=45286 RepID=A0A0X8HW45_9SACH|nr:HHL246Cp [Eremothecium sinecaudum]AMD22524.1 HHL246Cp [Eremothecium sinecaudum]